MQKLNQKTEHKADEGWIIHIYDCNRRLLCALDPSHGWSFATGLGLGLLVSIVGYNLLPLASDSAVSAVPSEVPAVTDGTTPTIELPLGID